MGAVWESTWSTEGNWESVWKSPHTLTHPAPSFPAPFVALSHISGLLLGRGVLLRVFSFLPPLFRPTLQIAFVLNCWCRRQRWAECKQGPKLFTLSRSRWRGWPNLFFILWWWGSWFCCFFFYWFIINWNSKIFLVIFVQFSLLVTFVPQSDVRKLLFRDSLLTEIIGIFVH